MPDLDEADFFLPGSQGFHDAVDAVAGEAEDYVDSPIDQAFNEYVCCCHELSRKLAARVMGGSLGRVFPRRARPAYSRYWSRMRGWLAPCAGREIGSWIHRRQILGSGESPGSIEVRQSGIAKFSACCNSTREKLGTRRSGRILIIAKVHLSKVCGAAEQRCRVVFHNEVRLVFARQIMSAEVAQ